MTTTVTIKTTEHPAVARHGRHHNHADPKHRTNGYTDTETFIEPQSEMTFHIIEGESFSANELPKYAEDLNYGCEGAGSSKAQAF